MARRENSNLRPIIFSLEPAPPFALELTVWALRRRPDNEVDRWDGQTYRRALPIAGEFVEVAVTQRGRPEAPRLGVSVIGARRAQDVESFVTAALNRMLGLQASLSKFYSIAETDGRLWRLAQRFRGLKPPRFPSVFEAVANGIACQQITLTLGIRVLNLLAETYGAAIEGSVLHAFPQPTDLARRDVEELKRLKLSRQKAVALTELSDAIVERGLDLERLATLDDDAAIDRLMQLRGVGRWTAEYILLRGLGRLHIFPGDDVGARNNLQRWLGLKKPLDYERTHRLLSKWRPYAGFIYFHLLLDRLSEAGFLTPAR
ncbi:MAG TPA: DNA-3-methyladenine glycosylase 2 family protein [Blastocatellia bacterium]|nr:DNA-3-methyladenine glycosylase 2 family protein [Blastocatellia bacterium]